jgi:hypothetical protein
MNEDKVAKSIIATLISVNESDSNYEDANVVDGLFTIARSLNRIATALDSISEVMSTPEVGRALEGLARRGE